MNNKYKIDCHFEYDRMDRPYGVFVWKKKRIFWCWQYIVAFKEKLEAETYIAKIRMLSEIF